MARTVTVSGLLAMQRNATNGSTVETDEGQAAESTPLNVPEQLAALEIHATPGSAYADVVKRLRTRCTLLDIPALDEEIAAEARRRCGMLPEPTVDMSASRVLSGYEDREGMTPNPDVADAPVEPMAEDRADEPTIADHLLGLNVGAQCTAEMSLHMITERVRDASRGLPLEYAPTENDVVLEAERIWVSLDRQRSHTYSVEQDGTIRDWRRPDPAPDRGPDVGTTHHTISDEARFSGAGAADGQQASMFLVPADSAFNGRQYRDASELANIAEKLIAEHGFLQQLENCDVRWYWKRKTGVSKGRVKIGFMKRASDLLGHFSGADFIGWLSATTARDGKFTDTQIEAAVFHQLCHIGSDDSGNWIFAPHDFEGFAAEVRVFGTWTSDLKLGGNAFVAAHQMGLFTDEEADEAEDDGAGVLIHDDGTPMTADEIAEMEAAELHGEEEDDDGDDDDVEAFDPLEDGDEPADPDGPAPDDEGDDPLADLDL